MALSIWLFVSLQIIKHFLKLRNQKWNSTMNHKWVTFPDFLLYFGPFYIKLKLILNLSVDQKCIVHADCNHHDPKLSCIGNTCTASDNSKNNINNDKSSDKNGSEKRDASVQTQSFESISDNAYHIEKSSSFSNNRHNSIHYNKLNSTSDGDATKFSSVESSVRDESTQCKFLGNSQKFHY